MSRKLSAVLLAGLLALAPTAIGCSSSDGGIAGPGEVVNITGSWNFYSGPTWQGTVRFVQSGSDINGQVSNARENSFVGVTFQGTISSSDIAMRLFVPGGKERGLFEGTVSADGLSMGGTWRDAGGSGMWRAERI